MDNNELSKAALFFDKISSSYKNKYNNSHAFHYYFFKERLEKATYQLDLNNKDVLDIGAGTGDLYDFLKNKYRQFNYFGTDVSDGMLKNSSIPIEKRAVGDYSSLSLPQNNFSHIFMLGVTTYLSEEQLAKYLQFICDNTAKQAKIIITFTNKRSVDTQIRRVLKPIIRLFISKDKVLSQNIAINTFSVEKAQKIIEKYFEIDDIQYLNHTTFPFNLIFKKTSVKIANKIDNVTDGRIKTMLSSDFIIRGTKK